MKKILIAAAMILSLATQIKANRDVVVDHSNRTVTVLANFISPAPIQNSMLEAANLWNYSSGKNVCQIPINGKDVNYTIHFRLVVNKSPLSDTALNIITVLPDNHLFFKSKQSFNSDGDEIITKAISVNDGKMIGISNSYKNDINVLAHEMGHLLGLVHAENQKCCHFDEGYFEVFQLSESVSNLATNSSKLITNTRKYTEVGDVSFDFIARIKK